MNATAPIAPPAVVRFWVDWRAESPNRWVEAWQVRQRRHVAAHRAFREAVEARGLVAPPLPVIVTLTRVSHGPGLDPADNLPASLKPCTDAVARFLGCDDRDARIEWRFANAPTSERVRLPVYTPQGNECGSRAAFRCYVRVEIRSSSPRDSIGALAERESQ